MYVEKKLEQITSIEDWFRLAPPKDALKQWVDGRSAKETARAWLEVPQSPPPEISRLLSSHPDFSALVVERVEPEAILPFDSRSGPRNADLAIVARDRRGPVAITVEAKADEAFDRTLSSLFDEALDRLLENPRSGGVARMIDLAQAILPPRAKGTVPASLISGINF